MVRRMAAEASPCARWFGRKIPEMMLSSVVFPLPDGPTMNSISPKLASKLASLTATVLASPSPKRTLPPIPPAKASACWLPASAPDRRDDRPVGHAALGALEIESIGAHAAVLNRAITSRAEPAGSRTAQRAVSIMNTSSAPPTLDHFDRVLVEEPRVELRTRSRTASHPSVPVSCSSSSL